MARTKRTVERLRTNQLEAEIKQLEEIVCDLENVFAKMSRNRSSFHDVIFNVDDKEIFANAVVLSARSTYFDTMLRGERTDNGVFKIEIPETDFEVFSLFIDLFYDTQATINGITDPVTCVDLVALCRRYQAVDVWGSSGEDLYNKVIFLLEAVDCDMYVSKVCETLLRVHEDDDNLQKWIIDNVQGEAIPPDQLETYRRLLAPNPSVYTKFFGDM